MQRLRLELLLLGIQAEFLVNRRRKGPIGIELISPVLNRDQAIKIHRQHHQRMLICRLHLLKIRYRSVIAGLRVSLHLDRHSWQIRAIPICCKFLLGIFLISF